ncbi:MAG: mechanosensitive ion channel family protein [Deltaproteobacteria bacterium]|nr:mechanosensitive ion channel family protein [Deltaproteobacteria bacterium]
MRADLHTKKQAAELRDQQLEDKAELCFDFSKVARERVDDIANDVLNVLIEILDRIEIPPFEDIPDAAAVRSGELTRWRIPDTEITIAKVKDGPREGEWLFSPQTVARLNEFYQKVKHLPYRPDAVAGRIGPFGGVYDGYVLYPEETFPSEWIDDLPGWAKTVYFEQPVWKWAGIVLVLLSSYFIFALIWRISRHGQARPDGNRRKIRWLKLLPPLSGAILALLADELIDEQINAIGIVEAAIETGLWAIVLFCWSWTIVAAGSIIADILILSPSLQRRKVNASLVKITTRIVSLVIAVWVVLEGADRFGISIVPMLAGLGVGGLAIALAVRPTLENLIGGFILFMDKPVRVGDLCRFGEQLGFVEEIGLRSTRIRKYEDTIVSVPNAQFSQLELENLSRRKKILFHVTLGLRYETTSDQLRYVLAKLREMLLGHLKVSPEGFRARFRRFGDYSLDIELFAYIRTNDRLEYWAIREDLNLRIMDIVKEAGTGFAFPSQTAYFTEDSGLDAEYSRKAEAQVEDWRVKGKLPFPEFDKEEP